MSIIVVGTEGQLGSSIQSKLKSRYQIRNVAETKFGTLIIAAGNSNSRLSEEGTLLAFERFHKFVLGIGLAKYYRVILISSGGSIYGEDSPDLVFEDFRKNPMTPYGRLKLKCEELLEELSFQFDFQLLIVRLANVYSSRLNGILGALFASIESNKEFTLLSRIDSTKQYGHADDYSEILLNLATSQDFWSLAPKVSHLNLFSSLKYSIQELISIVEDKSNRRVDYDTDLASQLTRNSVILGTQNRQLQELIESYPWRDIETFLGDEIKINSRFEYLRQGHYR